MGQNIAEDGRIVQGKYEGFFVYIWKANECLSIHKERVYEAGWVTVSNKQSSQVFIINKDSITDTQDMGSAVHKANTEAVLKVGFWFGAVAAMAANQIGTRECYTVAIEYPDGERSLLQLNSYAYQTFKAIEFGVNGNKQNRLKDVSFENSGINDFGTDLQKVDSQSVPVTQKSAKRQITINTSNLQASIKRAYLFLEEEDWETADEYFDSILDIDPETAEAYLGKLMVELRVSDKAQLNDISVAIENNINLKRALRFADENLKTEIESYLKNIRNNCNIEANKKQKKSDYISSLIQKADKLIYELENLKTILSSFSEAKEYTIEDINDSFPEDEEINRLITQLVEYETEYNKLSFFKKKEKQELSQKINKAKERLKVLNCTKGKKKQTLLEEKNRKIKAEYEKQYDSINHDIIIINDSLCEIALELEKNGKREEAYKIYQSMIHLDYPELKNRNDLQEFIRLNKYKTQKQEFAKKYGGIIASDNQLALQSLIAANSRQLYAITPNKTVIQYGLNNRDDSDIDATAITDTIAVSSSERRIMLLNSNGTVSINNWNMGSRDTKRLISGWENVISIAAGELHYVALKSDGSVVAENYISPLDKANIHVWFDIISIAAGSAHTVGLKKDGTVLAVGRNSAGQCNVSDWKNIIAISAKEKQTVGLRADGTVIAIGENAYGQCKTSSWRNIIAVSAGDNHTVGLQNDGTVVAVGDNSANQCNVDNWNSIVAIFAGHGFTVGLKSDGTVLSTSSSHKSINCLK